MAVPDLPGPDQDGRQQPGNGGADKDTARDGSGHAQGGGGQRGRAGSITLNLSEVSKSTLKEFEVSSVLLSPRFSRDDKQCGASSTRFAGESPL